MKEKQKAVVVAALIWQNGKFLICQRPAHKKRALLYEFVGGKVEPGETHEAALKRECFEELAVEIEVQDLYMRVQHEYPDIAIELFLYHAVLSRSSQPPQMLEHVDLRFIEPQEIPNYSFCPADQEILEKLMRESC